MQDMGLFEKGLYRTPNDQYNRQHDDQLWDLGIPYFPDKWCTSYEDSTTFVSWNRRA
jgi:hypothetical protein